MYACLVVPMPPSTNALWRHGAHNTYRTTVYTAWIAEAGHALKQQQPPKIRGHYKLTLTFGPRRSNADLGNRGEKAVSDLLETHRIIENDNLADEIHLYWDENVIGCQIEIEQNIPVRARVGVGSHAPNAMTAKVRAAGMVA